MQRERAAVILYSAHSNLMVLMIVSDQPDFLLQRLAAKL